MGGGRTFTKLMLNSTQVEVKVEVGVELGNFFLLFSGGGGSFEIHHIFFFFFLFPPEE